ncbi:hypothetical protein BJX64DRAFT_247982 [Aspergillus heterothallicus]
MAAPSRVTEVKGDLFQIPPDGAALIQACNCRGTWGGGIARTFAVKYPAAYKVYTAFCLDFWKNPHYLTTSRVPYGEFEVKLPEGHTLIIPPQKEDYEKPQGRKHWVICLFTSYEFGKRKAAVDVILRNTELALADMKAQLPEHEINGLYTCQINAGLFNVPWPRTKKLLEELDLDITVVAP